MQGSDLLRRLDRLLEEQRTCLLSGRITDLARTQKQLESFLRPLGNAELGTAEASELREKLDKNARLVNAAMAGLRTARSRIIRYGGPAPRFTTYTDPR